MVGCKISNQVMVMHLQGQRLPDLRVLDADLRIHIDDADRSFEENKVGFQLGHRAGQQELHIGPTGRELIDLEIILEVVHANHGIGLVDLHGHRLTVAVCGQCFGLGTHLEGLLPFGGPPDQLFTIFRATSHRATEIAVYQCLIGSFDNIDDEVLFVNPKIDFLRSRQALECAPGTE